jgi:hypothetical protein
MRSLEAYTVTGRYDLGDEYCISAQANAVEAAESLRLICEAMRLFFVYDGVGTPPEDDVNPILSAFDNHFTEDAQNAYLYLWYGNLSYLQAEGEDAERNYQAYLRLSFRRPLLALDQQYQTLYTGPLNRECPLCSGFAP